jgi:hypothetical protein
MPIYAKNRRWIYGLIYKKLMVFYLAWMLVGIDWFRA